MSNNNSLFLGYIGGALTFGFLLPWLDKKLKNRKNKK